MADIRFATINVVVYSPRNPSLIVVSWEFEKSVIPLSRYEISIYRGESPEELQRIASGIPAELFTEFEDRTAKIMDLQRTYHYRVVAHNKTTGADITSAITTWEGEIDIVGLYVVTEHAFLYRHMTGMPCYIYKKHTDGQTKCPNCWDPIAKRVTKSNCTECHGTGNVGQGVGGYLNPTYSWLDLNPDPEQIQIAQWGRVQNTQTDVMMTNYPRMLPGDLVFELLTNNRWKVASVHSTEKRRTKMLQIVRLDMLTRDDVEYTIDVPKEVKERAQREVDAVKKIREF
jgi:hypothetical protein